MYHDLFLDELDGVEGGARVEEVDGPTAWAVLGANNLAEPFEPELNGYLKRLLLRSDARAVVYEAPPLPGLPTGAILIPWPTTDTFEAVPDGSPGLFLFFGIGSEETRTEDPALSRTGGPVPWPVLHESGWNSSKVKEQDLLVFVHGTGCPASIDFADVLKSALKDQSHLTVVVDVNGEVTQREIRKLLGEVQFPMLLYVQRGKIADLHIGINVLPLEKVLSNFLARNGLIPGSPSLAADFRNPPFQRDTWIRRMSVLNHWPASDFRGSSLREVRLARGSLSGSALQDADLRDADLRFAILSHANLRNAMLEGAKLDGVFWRNTICPDGTNSEENGGTCEGHLQTSRSPQR